jgi:hypothetical protein
MGNTDDCNVCKRLYMDHPSIIVWSQLDPTSDDIFKTDLVILDEKNKKFVFESYFIEK